VPNPFFENTEIKIISNKDQFATIKIIDLRGKPIWVKKALFNF
jgi:hypothetical protein